MHMTGTQLIAARREEVWAALNDVDVLRQCIPGCRSIKKLTNTDIAANGELQFGLVRATFSGKVKLLDLDPPNGCRMRGEGRAGVAGYAKGGGVVRLIEDGAGTLLTYEGKADLGGTLGWLSDAAARKLAGEFFERFGGACHRLR
jgi:carbon monoxide dehydrogenase subunit G